MYTWRTERRIIKKAKTHRGSGGPAQCTGNPGEREFLKVIAY